jgi:hypothetical protein
VRGDLLLEDINSTNPQVFSGMRKISRRASVALVSFSDKAETTTIKIPTALSQPVSLQDVYTGEIVKTVPTRAGTFTVTLKPFQAVAGQINSR